MNIKKGSTDVTTYVNLVDSAAGTPETGLTITNIDATYTRNRAAAVKNDLTALGAVNSAHADNQGIEVDATNAPGIYRIDWPDAAFATGVDKVVLTVTCSGCAPASMIVQLVNYDPEDAVRLGLTSLPNAAADAAFGLPISDAGGLDLDARLDAAVSSRMATYTQPTGFLAASFPSDPADQSLVIAATDALLAAIAALNNLSSAQAQSAANAALVANNLDHLVGIAVDTDFATTVHVDSVVGQLAQTADGGFSRASDSLEAIRDRGDAAWVTGSGGAGTGARTVTITVNDGAAVLEGAKVRMSQGAESYVVATNASGVAVFSLDDATWAVAITKPGYTFTPTTRVVDGNETQTYSMTAVTITPSDPGQVTGYLTCFGADGEVESGVAVYLEQQKPASGSGIAYDSARRSATSNGSGVAQFTNLFPGARYRLWRGTDAANAAIVTIPSGASDPYPLDSIVGKP